MNCSRRRRTPLRMKQTMYQLYYYKKFGRLSTAPKITVPLCVQKEIAQLEDIVRYMQFAIGMRLREL
ncbi:hypothetical protein P3T76_007792 [Phytophthora citrophthora]|uniref:Uncharacterized protein n=1 Tax=Phytophthora citrophthora TaxID=4793 RepID=A0AAD9GNF7_9STRA|nr:hypothetical protein P3T76_007792 [Phytophthora citrophthora]